MRLRRTAVALIVVPALVVPAAASAQTTGRLVVSLRPITKDDRAQASAARAVTARAGARLAFPIRALNVAVVTPGPGQTRDSLARRLRADPGVTAVQPEHMFKLRYVPNDPALTMPEPNTPLGTTSEWWAAGMNLFEAWDISKGDSAVVAVIDTGIDAEHPELVGRIKHAVDFDTLPKHGGARSDEVGHGTHVSSLACAAADNGIGIAGAGFGCRILAVKTDLSEGSVARSIAWAVDHKADAINMSFGTDGSLSASKLMRDAIAYALHKDAVLVAAAADDPKTEQGDPANLLQPSGTGPNLNRNKGLVVTAAIAGNTRASFAGFGSQISIAAYGAYASGRSAPGILGAFPTLKTELDTGTFSPPTPPCSCRSDFGGDMRYARLQGTSMAAPMVAAVAALVRNLNPDLSQAQVVRLVKKTATRTKGWNSDLGWGILNGGAALRMAADTDAGRPRSKAKGPSTADNDEVELHWAGRDPRLPGVRVSGVSRYEIWRSVEGDRPSIVKRTKRESGEVPVIAGKDNAFYSIAIDSAGNRERRPNQPDLRVRAVARGTPQNPSSR